MTKKGTCSPFVIRASSFIRHSGFVIRISFSDFVIRASTTPIKSSHALPDDPFMRLSDEIFENLLWSLGSDDAARPDELRRTPRVGSSGIAMLFPIKDGRRDEGREVAIRDISAEGASLLLGSRLQVEQFILELPSRRAEPVTILCSLRHCDKSPKGGWIVGAEFLRFLSRPVGAEPKNPGSAKA